MKITSVEFVKSVVNLNDIPKDNLKEIAIAGRSNVGKSSLINCLLNRKKLAKTSSTPGKTRQLNYFKINDRFYFVDLPGYGYAKVSKKESAQWRGLIEGYIIQSPDLMAVLSIIDSRIGPTALDTQLFEWLTSLNLQLILVATKSDKLSKSELNKQIAKFSEQLKPFPTRGVIPFSAVTGSGKKEVWREILALLE
ncbi:YihA family ribosome biogenesis GTP-binding protein [candidate division KSB1 bacterium]|nr:YihA family ribosome biogenesis GTP-binding protein [candidate division KSB1 bacterium]NIR73447.1 YihA family ribosome biogenesis GTP-binding protein [candidate division KSB1 bacterium]NIS27062.1 YihA family ribosome biogenesis GTP-binding protein [candidate division KSB1 bacterium]NIT73906.1 YihA family ribosome biogenesis GTP-binding protein [candidate division KSB1 bacterium]NIU27807.1 YihA family ribosome biogenesis GTP-binding protein [candidate division KSB1 bacterium]